MNLLDPQPDPLPDPLDGARRVSAGFVMADGTPFTPVDFEIIFKRRERLGYAPYCLVCSTMARMKETDFGFVCDPTYVEPPLVFPGRGGFIPGHRGCGNQIDRCGFHYFPLADPANEAEAPAGGTPVLRSPEGEAG